MGTKYRLFYCYFEIHVFFSFCKRKRQPSTLKVGIQFLQSNIDEIVIGWID